MPIEVCRSILQGCILSVCFTRVYLLKDMVKLVKKHPQANATIFVDDTASDAYADTLQDTAEIVIWGRVSGPYPLWLSIWASRAIDRQSIGNQ